MKSITKILGLAALLLLGSCSKDDSSPLSPAVQSSSSGVYLSGSVGLDEARSLSHTLEAGSPIELTMNFMQAESEDYYTIVRSKVARHKPRASFSGSRSEVLLVLKSDNASQPVSYVKVPVIHKDDRSFEIDGNVDVALAPGTNLGIGNWYALGFVYSSGKSSGQTVAFNEASKRLEITAPSGGTYTASEYDASTEAGSTLTAPSVYMFDWMPLSVTTSGGRTKAKFTSRAQLKPQGALLLMEVSNLSMRNVAYDPESWSRSWRGDIHHLSPEQYWRNYDGSPAYANLKRVKVEFPLKRIIDYGFIAGDIELDNDGWGQIDPNAVRSGSLDGHYDLSAAVLDVTRSPKLNMGTTYKMGINFPERKFYYSEKDQDKPMHWFAIWMAPNEEGSATSTYHGVRVVCNTDGIDPLVFNRMEQSGGMSFYEPYTQVVIPGIPRNGTVVYRQIQWGKYLWGRT